MFELYATAPESGLATPLDKLTGSRCKMENCQDQIERVCAPLLLLLLSCIADQKSPLLFLFSCGHYLFWLVRQPSALLGL